MKQRPWTFYSILLYQLIKYFELVEKHFNDISEIHFTAKEIWNKDLTGWKNYPNTQNNAAARHDFKRWCGSYYA